jgi:hypothetical protein
MPLRTAGPEHIASLIRRRSIPKRSAARVQALMTLPSTRPPPGQLQHGAPTELPAIASLKESWMFEGGSVQHEYRLAGPANADTATPDALTANPRSLAVHPATYLTVDFNPGVGKFEVPADPAFSNIETVDVNGVMGQLTTMKNGLGVIRLDWVDAAGNYHVVMVDRLKTSDGLSGLSVQQILAVGRSVM